MSQAKILGDSLVAHNPEYRFIIGLVDKKSSLINYEIFLPHEIVPIEEIGIPDFDSLWQKFNIIELNTAVKPSFFKYVFLQFPDLDFLFYMDPDIMIFSSLQKLEDEFEQADILLTPHIISPIPLDGSWPCENTFLNYGIYNLGFVGIKNGSKISDTLLNWWEERTLSLGYIDVANGIFVDQLWLNLAPIYFQKVKIIKALGYNVAPWNLHERTVQILNDKYIMQNGSDLVFYHFSSYSYLFPNDLSKYYSRYNFANCPELIPLYKDYLELLKKNDIYNLSKIQCFYIEEKKKLDERINDHKKPPIKMQMKKAIKLLTPPFLLILVKKIL